MYKRIVLFILFAFTFALAQDQIPGSRQITVPENIQSIKNAIRDAETNEDWEAYKQLRTQLIDAWQQVNPDVAKLYGNINDGTPDKTPDGMPADHPRTNINNSKGSILFESSGYNQSNSSLWGDDKLVTGGTAFDISMDISRDGEIYLAVVGRLDGTSTQDSCSVFLC